MKLRLLDPEAHGKIIDLGQDGIVIGRDATCDLVFPEEGVSREHARIVREGKRYVVVDLGSRNGVRVNGKRIEERKSLLNNDRIGIGEHIMLFTDERDILAPDKVSEIDHVAEAKLAGEALKSGQQRQQLQFVLIAAAVVVTGVVLGLMFSGTPKSGPPETPVDEAQPSDSHPRTTLRPQRDRTTPEPVATAQGEPEEVPQYYWIDSRPAGAEVIFDDRNVGRTPLLLPQVATGPHQLQLHLTGYRPFERAIHVPQSTAIQPFALEPADGSCTITSEPTGAAVLHGSQYLGQTPLTLSSLKPGEHEVKIVIPGYVSANRRIILTGYRAITEHVALTPDLGRLAIVTSPPGATVYISRYRVGVTRPKPSGKRESVPLIVDGLKSGEYSVRMAYWGVRSASHRVKVEAGKISPVTLRVWLADTVIKTIDGKELRGMLKARNRLGDVILAVNPKQDINLVATQIFEMRQLTEDEYRGANAPEADVEDDSADDNTFDEFIEQ